MGSGCGHGAATIPGGVLTCRGVDVSDEREGCDVYRPSCCFGYREVVEVRVNCLLPGVSKLEFRRRLTFRKGGLGCLPSFTMLIALCTSKTQFERNISLTLPLSPDCFNRKEAQLLAHGVFFFFIFPKKISIRSHLQRAMA